MQYYFGLDFDHFVVNVLHGHISAKLNSSGQIATVTGIACRHHVAGIKHGL